MTIGIRIRLWRPALLAVLLLVFTAISTQGAWRVDLESKVVAPGEQGVTVDVTGYWESDLGSITIPLVVREIDAGAYWTGDLPYDTNGSAGNHPYAHGVTWHWTEPWAVLVEEVRPGVPGPGCAADGDLGYDGVSPDHFCINVAGMPGAGGTAVAPAPQGNAFVTITFDVTTVLGEFEIDTACFSSSLSDIFLCEPFVMGEPELCCYGPVEPGGYCGSVDFTFHKGIITIAACDCGPVWGDVTSDGTVDPLDVSYMIAYVFKGHDQRTVPPNCPHDCGDVNCDGRVDPLDIAWFVYHVYISPISFPCGPCS
jgi:hypothetical protein